MVLITFPDGENREYCLSRNIIRLLEDGYTAKMEFCNPKYGEMMKVTQGEKID